MSTSEAYELVADFASMVMELQEPSAIWPSMLMRLQDAIGFEAGYIAASWGNATEGRGAIAEHDEPSLKRNLGRYLAEISPEEVAQYTDRARIHHEIWSPARQRELAVFNEVLHPSGMQHMIVRVGVRHGNVAGFNLERRSATPFTLRELTLVDVIAPFLHIVEVLTLRGQDDARVDEFAQNHGLTDRERELVGFAIRGLQNNEIALLVDISAHTVRNTLAKVFEKVGVTNRSELTYLASHPTGDRDGKASIVPPRSRLPGDGLQAFIARVEDASSQVRARAASEPPPARPRSRIVYTAPLTPTTA
ncbi:MAG TPA: helix-turn-helix transcriptional regulator [Polyangiaceae bacterium]|jgi:DNA-binding CsgD family transcriptional regulator|nr:helix-turn-helix transcriptional regulator [Polyangiaceae bacterium]